jgi:oligopeptide/dipeptide ABC transporter ATP-binding protein
VLKAAQRETNAAIVLITHDLGLIAELADRVVVMYAGRVVELADVFTIFSSPRHPYTLGLMSSLARLDTDQDRLEPIPGQPPSLITVPPGCAFHPRCVHSQGREICRTEVPPLRSLPGEEGHISACHFAEELVVRDVRVAVAPGGGA